MKLPPPRLPEYDTNSNQTEKNIKKQSPLGYKDRNPPLLHSPKATGAMQIGAAA
jgi:hypothetical protein